MKQKRLTENTVLTYVEDRGSFYLTEIEFSKSGFTPKQLARLDTREEVESVIANW
jgi:hypothetical protein